MRILVSAFAFAPHTGSEPGVGWRWAVELARGHEVTVITDPSRAAKVAAASQAALAEGLSIVYWRPRWLRRVPLNARTAHLMYLAWQFGLLFRARRLHLAQPFDMALHLTYGVFRHPCFLGYLGIPFVLGPVGGGEDVPWALKKSLPMREKAKELLRGVANAVARIDPFLWLALRRTSLILAKTGSTRDALPAMWRAKTVVFPEIGIDSDANRAVLRRAPDEPMRILFVGRLLGWKGVHLALRAVSLARAAGVNLEFTIVGSGPCNGGLRKLASELGLGPEVVRWHAHMPQQQLFSVYASSHCFLFPSLHDSSGNVVLEAQSFGLPVVCLDCGGPRELVTARSARLVSTTGSSETSVALGLCDALIELANDEPARSAMAASAIEHVREMSWQARVQAGMSIIRDRLVIAAESTVA
jgi:glycosyltransferase involved in cell wall biosynthesis